MRRSGNSRNWCVSCAHRSPFRLTETPPLSVFQAKPPAPIKKEPAAHIAASATADTKAGGNAGASGLVPMEIPQMTAAGSTLTPVQVTRVQLPEAGRPCLQSTRLFTVDASLGAAGGALSKNLLRKATSYLAEVGLPPKPMPTRAVCDLVDAIRRDTVALLSLHNAINKREKSLSAATAAAMGISTGPSVSAGAATIKAEKASKGDCSSLLVFAALHSPHDDDLSNCLSAQPNPVRQRQMLLEAESQVSRKR